MNSLRSVGKSFVLYYLKLAAKIQLLKINPKIIGIGGSSGKTSTTGFIETILKEKYKVRGTKGKNSETGIPLSILGISISNYNFLTWLRVIFSVPLVLLFDFKKYDYLVAEMGVDGPNPPNNMEYLLGILSPKTAVLTNITYEHSLNFEILVPEGKYFAQNILDLISREELKILMSLSEKDNAILNLDDPAIAKNLEKIKAKKITVSAKKDADFKIDEIAVSESKFELKFSFENKQYLLKINKPLPNYFAYSFLLSIAVCYAQGVSIRDSISILEKNFVLPAGRASVFKGIKSITIIDSSYNSSLDAAAGMLELLKTLGNGKRKVAIIGDMREQGKMSQTLHEKLARELIETSDFCILIGPLTNQFIAPILKDKNFPFEAFGSFSKAKERIHALIKENDVILVKSSQNTLFLERAVELLLEDKNDAGLLARRGEYWEKLRETTP